MRPSNVSFLERQKAVVEMIAAGQPLELVLNELALTIEQQGEAFYCSICLLDEAGTHLLPVVRPSVPRAFRDATAAGVRVGPNTGSCGAAAFRRAPVVVADVATDPLWADLRDVALANGIRACWSTPIFSTDRQLLGTFALYYREPRLPTTAEKSLVEEATHIAAIAIDRNLSEQTITRLAYHDQLTGLPNRNHLEKLVTDALDVAERSGRMVAFLFLDLDHFKRVNDTVGHRRGDQLLRKVARRLRGCLGPSTTVARLGGDEFVLLLGELEDAGQTNDAANKVLRCMRRTVRLGEFRFDTTASIGVSLFPLDGTSPDALFECADQAMYDAKAAGRNRARFFNSDIRTSPWLPPADLATQRGTGEEPDSTRARITFPEEMRDCQELVEHVRFRLGAELVCLRLLTTTDKLVTLGLSAKTTELKGALDQAVEQGEIGGVIPQLFDRPRPVAEARLASLLSRNPGVLTPNAWIENLSIGQRGELIGVLTVVGDPRSCAPLHGHERSVLKAVSCLQILANNEGRRRLQLERKLDFITNVSTGLSSTAPLVERLRRAVAVTQEALDFDSVQLITWNPTRETVLLNALYVKNAGFIADTTWDAMTKADVDDSIEDFKRSPKPRVLPDPDTLPSVLPQQRAWMRRNGIRFLLIVPLMHEGEQYGTLMITSRFSRRETEERLAMLASVGGHLAAILQLSLLLAEVQESYATLRRSHLNTVETLAVAAEMRDRTTGEHLRSLRELSQLIGRRLGLAGVELEDLGFAAVVHDIGKLRLPDSILLKPATLDADEWEIVRTHPEAGESILESSELPAVARQVVRWHHEHWDGRGYPDGLRGDQIPLPAQIVAVADVFDALTSERPYKPAWSIEAAVEEIRRSRGAHLSPAVTDAFLSLDVGSIARRQRRAA